jgi:hypothetical protein
MNRNLLLSLLALCLLLGVACTSSRSEDDDDSAVDDDDSSSSSSDDDDDDDAAGYSGSGAGGAHHLTVEGVGPWNPAGGEFDFDFENEGAPNDSPGTTCSWSSAAGTYSVRGSWGFAWKGFGTGGRFEVNMNSGWTGPGTYAEDLEVVFRWDSGEPMDPSPNSNTREFTGGVTSTCTATFDTDIRSARFDCPDMVAADAYEDVPAPVTVTGTWSCPLEET